MPPNNDDSFLLGEMNAKLDQLLAGRATDIARTDKLEERLRKLEQFRWMILGGAMAAGGATNWLVKVLTS